jgi:hypothetical protein
MDSRPAISRRLREPGHIDPSRQLEDLGDRKNLLTIDVIFMVQRII